MKSVLAAIVLGVTVSACGHSTSPAADAGADDAADAAPDATPFDPTKLSLLVFTRENMWVHPSNPIAAKAIAALGAAQGWNVMVTADQSAITPDVLARTDVVLFSVTSGPVLDQPQRTALEAFFSHGGGFVGTHSASATEPDWPFYRQMVPVTFKTHPSPNNLVTMELNVLDTASPLLADMPSPWVRTDEYYTFNERPEDNAALHLLIGLDETSSPYYPDADKVGFHPLAFTNETMGNRAFYTALGHTPESYNPGDPMLTILQRAIEWSAGGSQRPRN